MRVSNAPAENLLASLLWLMIAGYAVSSCVASRLRTVTPPNAPPDISRQMATDTPAHRGMSIGAHGFLGHEIVAAADGVVVFVNYTDLRGGHVRIHHGLDLNKQDIYTEHHHVQGQLLREGDRFKRGQTLGFMGPGARGRIPHYHYLVIKEESPGKFIALDPSDYWFGIDQYKEKLERGLDVGPFVISCFDPNVDYQKEPIRFTYPVKCK